MAYVTDSSRYTYICPISWEPGSLWVYVGSASQECNLWTCYSPSEGEVWWEMNLLQWWTCTLIDVVLVRNLPHNSVGGAESERTTPALHWSILFQPNRFLSSWSKEYCKWWPSPSTPALHWSILFQPNRFLSSWSKEYCKWWPSPSTHDQ